MVLRDRKEELFFVFKNQFKKITSYNDKRIGGTWEIFLSAFFD